jgi:hypothetical protein
MRKNNEQLQIIFSFIGETTQSIPCSRVGRGRLWRKSNSHLDEATREHLVGRLMSARRAVRDAQGDSAALAAARKRVDAAKIALGERGPIWWNDGSPDLNRHLPKNTPYADWFAALATERE